MVQKQALVQELKKVSQEQKMPLWKRVAMDLEKPSRQQRVVNLSRIELYATEKDTVIVPGKVLGEGEFTKKITIAAYSFSQSAITAITKAGGKAILLQDFIRQQPKPKQAKIIG